MTYKEVEVALDVVAGMLRFNFLQVYILFDLDIIHTIIGNRIINVIRER